MTNTKLNNSLFIFRRDLRLQDNTALDEALTHSKIVIPVFIFDERQLGDNPYKSTAAIEFMLESLAELNSDLNNYGSRLYCFKGVAEKIFERLINEISIDAIFLNTDYTPFSRMRDDRIKQNAIKTGIKFFDYHDALLHPPGTVIKDDGKPYTVYTPFAKKARSKIVPKPKQLAHSNFYTGSLEG
ncbi:MAG: deoxyribodipyrimidine photo-lyase, partial [Bdellovibrionales bacterium]|nr:deoxyribodipyrimidine photo-lyase [Bdellovibrionales bacterium]